MGFLFESLGIKRQIASLLSVVVEVLRAVPGSAEVVTVIELIAGFFGITGVSHASAQGTVTRKKLATASAAIASLVAISYFVPVLMPLRPWLEKAAALIGAAAIGVQVGSNPDK